MSLVALHPDLLAAQQQVYEPLGFIAVGFVKDAESDAYGAFAFTLNQQHIQFRVAKVTPIKAGQFVTLWKRSFDGPIMPFDSRDPVDFMVISVRSAEHFGQFIFPKALLVKQKVLSNNGFGGKRAMRVYPPWAIHLNRQALKTQQWQSPFFLAIPHSQPLDILLAKKLLSL